MRSACSLAIACLHLSIFPSPSIFYSFPQCFFLLSSLLHTHQYLSYSYLSISIPFLPLTAPSYFLHYRFHSCALSFTEICHTAMTYFLLPQPYPHIYYSALLKSLVSRSFPPMSNIPTSIFFPLSKPQLSLIALMNSVPLVLKSLLSLWTRSTLTWHGSTLPVRRVVSAR